MPWLSLAMKYWKQIGIFVLVVIVLLYVASLKSEIGDLKGIVADYKIEMHKANEDNKRLSGVNAYNINSHGLIIKDYNAKLASCHALNDIQVEKENDLLGLIEALRNREPEIVETTVHTLEKCVVTVSIPTDTNQSTLLNRLNKNFGGF